jgi:hypothetical protein
MHLQLYDTVDPVRQVRSVAQTQFFQEKQTTDYPVPLSLASFMLSSNANGDAWVDYVAQPGTYELKLLAFLRAIAPNITEFEACSGIPEIGNAGMNYLLVGAN